MEVGLSVFPSESKAGVEDVPDRGRFAAGLFFAREASFSRDVTHPFLI